MRNYEKSLEITWSQTNEPSGKWPHENLADMVCKRTSMNKTWFAKEINLCNSLKHC